MLSRIDGRDLGVPGAACSASRSAPPWPSAVSSSAAIAIAGDSIWIPILIIGLVYVPYIARPIRGEILALREKEFIEAAVAQGKGPLRIMISELLPNIISTIIVFFTLNIANNMLLESALSFLGAGVRPPNASWGTMISDGYQVIFTAPHLTVVPGLMIVLTVLSLNVFGDGLARRDGPEGEDPVGALADGPFRRKAAAREWSRCCSRSRSSCS